MPEPQRPLQNAIAELDARIAQAGTIRARYVQELKALPVARRPQALLRVRVAIAEERLDRLRRSREAPLAAEEGR